MANNFLLFDQNKVNILTDEEYSTDGERLNGMAQGISRSILFNKILYQSSSMYSALAKVIEKRGLDALDSNQQSLVNNIDTAFPQSRGLPVGIILSYSGKTLPTGFLWANGDAFDPSVYPDLAKAYLVSGDTYLYGQVQQATGVWWPKTPIIYEDTTFGNRVDYPNRKAISNGYVFEADGIIWGAGGGNHRTYYYGVTNSRGTYTRLMTYDWGANYGSPDNFFSLVNKGDTFNAVNITPQYAPFISNSTQLSAGYKIINALTGFNTMDLTGIGPHAELINVNIPVSAWSSSTNEATVSVANVDIDSNIDLGLPVPTSFNNSQAVSAAGLVITGLGDGEITFTCKKIPEVELNVTLKLWTDSGNGTSGGQ